MSTSLETADSDVSSFYDNYGSAEWERLEKTAYGRLQAIIHTGFLREYVQKGAKVLDAGAGPGRFSIELSRVGARVTVQDISAEQLRIAEEKITKARQSESIDDFLQGSIADLSTLPDSEFDVVVCFGGALTYVRDERFKAIEETSRVLKPGGIVLASVMSRHGAAINMVNQGETAILSDSFESVARAGELPPFPSRRTGRLHPAMHLYSSEELRELFGTVGDVLAIAGSNVTVREGNQAFEGSLRSEEAWSRVVELERAVSRAPGLTDVGSHIIVATRKTNQ